MIAEIKKKWGQVISGIQSWLSSLDGNEVMVSLFTFGSAVHNQFLLRKPKELTEDINRGLEANGESNVSLPITFETTKEIIMKAKSTHSDWLHYEVLMTVEDNDYPEEAVNDFLRFKREHDLQYFFNAITQVSHVFEITKVATALDGVCYFIKRNAGFNIAFIEGLERNPFKEF